MEFTSARCLAHCRNSKSQRSWGHGSRRGVKPGLVFGRDTWLGLETWDRKWYPEPGAHWRAARRHLPHSTSHSTGGHRLHFQLCTTADLQPVGGWSWENKLSLTRHPPARNHPLTSCVCHAPLEPVLHPLLLVASRMQWSGGTARSIWIWAPVNASDHSEDDLHWDSAQEWVCILSGYAAISLSRVQEAPRPYGRGYRTTGQQRGDLLSRKHFWEVTGTMRVPILAIPTHQFSLSPRDCLQALKWKSQ